MRPGEIETAPPESFLYQAGYLTLREGISDALAAEALKQIKGKQYADPYANAKKIGLAIDDKARQVGAWVEAIP